MEDVSVLDEDMDSSSMADTESVEPTPVEQNIPANITEPDPGSVPLVSERGSLKFPRVPGDPTP